MAYLGPVRRWDVFWADLEPTVGREQAGDHRPVLVVSSDRFSNSPLRLVMGVPLSAREGKRRFFDEFEIPLPTGLIEPDVTPVAMTHQLRSLSTLRLLDYAGRLDDPDLYGEIEDALVAHLGIELE